MFVFPCIILLDFAVNFAKHHKKKDNVSVSIGPEIGKKGPQNGPEIQNDAKTIPK